MKKIGGEPFPENKAIQDMKTIYGPSKNNPPNRKQFMQLPKPPEPTKETMKTAEEILIDKVGKLALSGLKWKSLNDRKQLIIEAMSDFAAQSVREDRESRWVSVKERLPETETGCYTSNGTNGQIAYLTGMTSTKTGLRMWQEDDGYFHHDITHWQPLPSPPTNKG